MDGIDIITNFLEDIDFPKTIVRIYYEDESTTDGCFQNTMIITSRNILKVFMKYKDSYLRNCIRMEVIDVASNNVETYRIKKVYYLEKTINTKD